MQTRDQTLLADLRLKLNIEHPALDDAWLEGYQNGHRNLTEASNPYRSGSEAYQYWREGWWAGFYGEEPIFSYAEIAQEEDEVETVVLAQARPLVLQQRSKKATNILQMALILAAALVAYTVYDLVT